MAEILDSENTLGCAAAVELDVELPPPMNIAFFDGSDTVGVLSWEKGELHFEGEADQSAKMFFESFLKPYVEGHFKQLNPNAIDEFVEAVERMAEEKMLKTGKLEGAHYAAMKELQRSIKSRGKHG
jgi:hypothetical protein